MKDCILNFIKKQWLILWIISAALTLTVLYASAEYLGENSVMKRVVVADSEQKSMFSSNILEENGTSAYKPQYISALSAEDITNGKTYDIGMLLWNYSRTNPSKWYPQDINYTLKAELVNQNGELLTAENLTENKTITILKDGEVKFTLSSSNLSDSFSDTLVHKTNSTTDNSYTIRFSNNWDLQNDMNICVRISATPDKGSDADKYKDISEISAIVGLRELQSMGSSGWQVYLNEQRIGGAPEDYDAYNLVVTGSGKADIVLTIDTNKLTFNRYFYNEILRIKNFSDGEVVYTEPGTNGIATLTIKADASKNRGTAENPEYRNRYDIQLYKKYDDTTTDPASWDFFAEDNGIEMSESVWLIYKIEDSVGS
ncbi:MAG: hypothetical protein ACI4JW_03315 [Oscillospiraceae bacterium]